MQVTIELEGTKATLESQDVQVEDCLDLCIQAMMGAGFHPSIVRQAVCDAAIALAEDTQ